MTSESEIRMVSLFKEKKRSVPNQMKANPDEYQALAIGKLEAQWAEPVSLTFHSALRKLNTEPSIGASHQISVHFGKAVSEKKIFTNRPI